MNIYIHFFQNDIKIIKSYEPYLPRIRLSLFLSPPLHQIRAIWSETNPITFLNPGTIDSSTINKNSEQRALHAARLINTKWNLLRVWGGV